MIISNMDTTFDLGNLLVPTPQGGLRIGNTRVSLDSVVYAYRDGATPEEICQDYRALSLAQVYATIACYLNNRDQVDRYLENSEQCAEVIRQDLDSRHKEFLKDLRQRLDVARQAPTRRWRSQIPLRPRLQWSYCSGCPSKVAELRYGDRTGSRSIRGARPGM